MVERKDISKVELPKADVFRHWYYELKRAIQSDKEVLERDFTKEINLYLLQKVKRKELINISLRGEPGTGKSVVALELFRRTNQLMEETYDKKIDLYSRIASDQTEFLRLAKRKDNEYTCIEIDEWNPLGNTGANSTTEQAEFEFFSHLCRVLYVHRIFCSPIKITDPNTTLILDIQGKDEKNQKTNVKILYRNLLENQFVEIGSAWIDVSKTLKSDWFKKYEKKKRARVDLLNEHGFRDVRELEFAEVGVSVIKSMSNFIGEISNKGMLIGLIKMKAINLMSEMYKRPISFIAEDEIVKPVMPILSAMKEIINLERKERKDNISRQVAIKFLNDEMEKQFDKMKDKVRILGEYRNIQ